MKKYILCCLISLTVSSLKSQSIEDKVAGFYQGIRVYKNLSDTTVVDFYIRKELFRDSIVVMRFYAVNGERSPEISNMGVLNATGRIEGTKYEGQFFLDTDSLYIYRWESGLGNNDVTQYYFYMKRTSIETGINKEIQNKLEVFPNPSKGQLNFNLPNKSKLEGLKVFTTQGVEIITGFELKQDTLFIGALLPGSYFATVTTDKQIYTFNFIKE